MLRFGGDALTLSACSTAATPWRRTGQTFISSLKALPKLKSGSQIARLVLEGASQIVDADGYRHESEVEWSFYAGQYLKQLAVRQQNDHPKRLRILEIAIPAPVNRRGSLVCIGVYILLAVLLDGVYKYTDKGGGNAK
ncbi:MAG TPA: hypothetical protein VIG90_02730 [Pedomonas sp.]|uniref:hypothetical protein n=1 Tax=Pedomonas sp. TaxID=2976421 RepID=UPI002F418A50